MDGTPPVYSGTPTGASAPGAYTPTGGGNVIVPVAAAPASLSRTTAASEFVTKGQLVAVRVATGLVGFVYVLSVALTTLQFIQLAEHFGTPGVFVSAYADAVRRVLGGVLLLAFCGMGASGSAATGGWRPTALGLGAALAGMMLGGALVDVLGVIQTAVLLPYWEPLLMFNAVLAALSVLAHGALTCTSVSVLVSGCSTVASSNVRAGAGAGAGAGGALLDPVEQERAAADAQAEPQRRTPSTHCVNAKHLGHMRVAGGVLVAYAVFRAAVAGTSIAFTSLFDLSPSTPSGPLLLTIYLQFIGRWVMRDCVALGVIGLALLFGGKRNGRHAYRPTLIGFAYALGCIVLGAQATDAAYAAAAASLLSSAGRVAVSVYANVASQPLNALVLGVLLVPVFIVLTNGARRRTV